MILSDEVSRDLDDARSTPTTFVQGFVVSSCVVSCKIDNALRMRMPETVYRLVFITDDGVIAVVCQMIQQNLLCLV